METIQTPNFKYLFALAILKKLWVGGYITEEEMKRIDERNKVSFGFTEGQSGACGSS
jgi:hypothetical protein